MLDVLTELHTKRELATLINLVLDIGALHDCILLNDVLGWDRQFKDKLPYKSEEEGLHPMRQGREF